MTPRIPVTKTHTEGIIQTECALVRSEDTEYPAPGEGRRVCNSELNTLGEEAGGEEMAPTFYLRDWFRQ